MDPFNFRPISLLPLISKIFKKIWHYEILCICQSGFRTKYLSDFCLSYLNEKVLRLWQRYLTGMILTDLQKALETTDYSTLLEKLQAIGFLSIGFIHIWLIGLILVSIKNKYSSISKISCGMPQGSILGPFLLYI